MTLQEAMLVLGITTTDSAVVKSAYRKAVKRCHPDLGGNKDEFNRVHEAYEVLSNPAAAPQTLLVTHEDILNVRLING